MSETAKKPGVFDWVPFYEELANKLVGYRERQRDLIDILENLRAQGLTITPLEDQDSGGRRFRANVLTGFEAAGIDITNPFEMLLAIRRVGSKRLETLFGPGEPAPRPARPHSDRPLLFDRAARA